MKRIVMTGGGTAGHVTPNVALFPALKEAGYEIYYIGSYNGIEKNLIEKEGIEYYGISSGKLRRYFALKNFTDPFRVMKGYREARKILNKIKPDVVFSKGGFVTVPVVFAAKKSCLPVIIHESDLTPGLANKLAIPRATYVCHNFPETAKYLPEGKSRAAPSDKSFMKETGTEDLSSWASTVRSPSLWLLAEAPEQKRLMREYNQHFPSLQRHLISFISAVKKN